MKVSLIVVQGKPEGKVIPLAVPRFRIGRGEGCHLRPNNEQVSRNHSEIELIEDRVVIRDLGSRNGTIVNNQRLEPNVDHPLKNKDLVQVGPLTFAVSIQGVAAAAAAAGPQDKAERALAKAGALDELSNDEIDSWLVTDKDQAAPPERPSGVYTGDTMTFSSYQEASKSDHKLKAHAPEPQAEPVPEPEVEEVEEEPEAEPEPEPEPAEAGAEDYIYDKLDDDGEEVSEELIDESNPFYAAKKQAEEQPVAGKKKEEVDSSRAAEDILRKMMERRRASR